MYYNHYKCGRNNIYIPITPNLKRYYQKFFSHHVYKFTSPDMYNKQNIECGA